MIIVYTGNGKGKTSASVGQAIRALGNGIPLCFVQFMKSDVQAGEQIFLQQLLQDNLYIGGKGFFRKEEERPKHREAVLACLKWIETKKELFSMLVCDEILYAYHAKLISKEEIENLISFCSANKKHLVLSGRYAPDWLMEQADIVSEIQEIKHACTKGVPAQKGIEF